MFSNKAADYFLIELANAGPERGDWLWHVMWELIQEPLTDDALQEAFETASDAVERMQNDE